MYQFRSDHNAVFDLPDWTLSWKMTTGGKINGSLSIVGNVLYAESFDKNLYAVDVNSGKVLWKAPLPNIAMNTPLVANGLVMVGCGSNDWNGSSSMDMVVGPVEGDDVLAFDANTGRPIWRFHTAGEDMATGAIMTVGDRPTFFLSNGDQHVYALDLSTGRLLWSHTQYGANPMSPITIYGGLLFSESDYQWTLFYKNWAAGNAKGMAENGQAWALNPSTKQFDWTAFAGSAGNSPTVSDGVAFVEAVRPVATPPPSVPATDQSDVMLALRYNIVQALDAKTGKLLWDYKSGSGTQSGDGSNLETPTGVVASGILYQGLAFSREFAAFDGRSGKLLWKIPTHAPIKAGGLVKDGIVYVGDTGGYLYVVRASTGALLNTIKFPGIFTASAPIIAGHTLFVANSKSVYAIPLNNLLDRNTTIE